MIIDFHLHTTASDGQYTPSEIVYLAHKLGIEKIAITDHDTLNGLDEAICTASQYSVEVLQGIELGASEHRYLHILGVDAVYTSIFGNALISEISSSIWCVAPSSPKVSPACVATNFTFKLEYAIVHLI